MTDQTARMQAAIEAMKYLAVIFPGADLPPETFEARCVMLAEIEPAQLQRAVAMCSRTCRFFPSVAEIFDAAREGRVCTIPAAGIAWLWLNGSEEIPDPEHRQLALDALRATGQNQADGFYTDDFHRREFCRAYDALVRRVLSGAPEDIAPRDQQPRVSTGGMEKIGQSALRLLPERERKA